MTPCMNRAYMSDPPPGAVLITNSTGFVGFSRVAADAAALPVAGAVVAAGVPPQAAPTRSATLIDAMTRLALACNMPAPPRTRTFPAVERLTAGLTRRHRNRLDTGGKS